jgi:ATP-dependent protease HslVU (ClpYQ) peptidase subunit
VTCCVGIEHAGGVVMGADSLAGSGDSYTTIRADEKLFRVDDLIIGFAGSWRAGQLLRYSFDPPERPENPDDIMRYLCSDFVDSVRACLSAGGMSATRESVEGMDDTSFLVAVEGKLYVVDSDFQVARSISGYAAIGSGMPWAEGALHATQKSKNHRARVILALEAAAESCAWVRPPFNILSTKT